MKTPDPNILAQQIEHLVQAHIEACRRTAREAIERAFAAHPTMAKPCKAKRALPTGAPKPRRKQADLEKLSEQLYELVHATPGSTMAMLKLALGAQTTDLQRPMAILKAKGRIRSAGARSMTRYYPIAAEEEVAA